VKRVGFLVGAGQLRFPAGVNGAEDMVVDDDMVVAQLFRRLSKRLDRSSIAAEFDLRINHTSFHRPLPLWSRGPAEHVVMPCAVIKANRCRAAD
jgi:hypothetical protein